jgi:hypothetical protein
MLKIISKEMKIKDDLEVLAIRLGSQVEIKYAQDSKKTPTDKQLLMLQKEITSRLGMPIELVLNEKFHTGSELRVNI